MSPNPIQLNVLVKDSLFRIRLEKTDLVYNMFDIALQEAPLGYGNLKHVTKDMCKFYKLNQPIPLELDKDTGLVLEATVNACKDTRAQAMRANQKITNYFSSDPKDGNGIHVVMQFPDVIRLNVLVHDALVFIDICKEQQVKVIYEVLSNNAPKEVKSLLKRVEEKACKLCKLDQPISTEHDHDTNLVSDATVNVCKDTPKKVMQPSHKIAHYFSSDPEDEDGIHVVIQLPIVKLNVLVHNAPINPVVTIDICNGRGVKDIYEVLFNTAPNEVKSLLQHVKMCNYKFYKPEQSISAEYCDPGLMSDAIVTVCKDAPRNVMQSRYKIARYFRSDPENEDDIHVVMQLPDVINMNVLVQNAFVSIDICNERDVKDIYEVLFNTAPNEVKSLLQHVKMCNYKFYKLEQSISAEYCDPGLVSDAIVTVCKDAPRNVMQPSYKIARYFRSDPENEDDIHVVMQLPDVINMNVLVQNAFVSIDICNERDVKDIYEVLSNTARDEVKSLLEHVKQDRCKLYKFEQPVSAEYDHDTGLVSNVTVNQCKTLRHRITKEAEKIKNLLQFEAEDQQARVHVLIELPKKVYRKIELNVLVQNTHATVDIHNSRAITDIYEEAQKLLPEEVTSRLQASTLTYAKLSPPVKYIWNRDGVPGNDPTLRRCRGAPSEIMKHGAEIANHFGCDILPNSAIHVIIMPPEDAMQKAINNMRGVDSTLYELLHVRRTNPKAWCSEDYPQFENNNSIVAHNEFKEKLSARRLYTLKNGNRFFKLALSVLGKDMFGKFLFEDVKNLPNNTMPDDPATVSDDPETVSVDELEHLIFSTLCPAFIKRIARFKGKAASSHFKQALFIWHFVLHPALAAEEKGNLHFTTENKSQIKYYVTHRNSGREAIVGSYRPQSDIAIISRTHGCPFLICEVDSNDHEGDKHRMLAVAVSAARVGQYLLKKGTADPFVLMAIFLTKNLIVERYLVSQKDVDSSEVVITEETFDIEEPEKAYEFLRQMYNFAFHADKMAKNLDDTKKGLLQKINEAGKDIGSFRSKISETRDKGDVPINFALPGIPENQNEGDGADQLWQRRDILRVLNDIGCNTKDIFNVDGHPGVICIPKKGKDLVYMKYISHRDIRELKILQYLKKFDPSWTYVLSFLHWDIIGGTLVEFPYGGVHVTEYLKPGSNPTPIALQLVEAVGFLHKHNVAHRDIKSENILVHPSGKLYVIDYSLARQVKGEDEVREGFVGTPGRVAPEVAKEGQAYSPVRADRWAVGYVIEIMCEICGSPLQWTLLEISPLLMHADPLLRLSMQTCSKLIKQRLSKQHAVNAIMPSKFMNGENHQPAVLAS